MTEYSAHQIFNLLNGRRYSARLLCEVAGVNANTLTNMLSKQKVELASKPTKQGRPREFCLIDVYQIAILAAFLKVSNDTRNLVASVRSLFLPSDVREVLYRISSDEKANIDDWTSHLDSLLEAANENACHDVRTRAQWLAERDVSKPFYLSLTEGDDQEGQYYAIFPVTDIAEFFNKVPVAAVINVTKFFVEIDRRLFQLVMDEGV